MRYHQYILLLTVLALLLPLSAHGQANDNAPASGTQGEVITFDEAVRVALQNSIAIRRAANAVASQQAAVSQQRSSLLPDLSLSLNTGRYYGQAFDQTVGELTYEGRTSASGSIGTSVTVFDGFQSWAELSQARQSMEASEIDLQHQRQQIIFEVMARYLDLIQARENVHIQEEALASARQHLGQVENQVRVGTRRATDLHEQRSQVASAELALLQARRGAQEQEGQMLRLLQLDPFGEYEFEIPRLEDNDVVPEQYEVAALIESAFERRQDVRAREVSIAASEQGVRAARSGWFPTIGLSASMGSSYTSLGIDPFSDQFFQTNRSEGVSLSISFPLFDRFQRRNQIRQATVELENAQLDLEEQRQEVAVEVRQAYLDYEGMIEELEVARLQEELAQASLEAAEQEYRVGRGSLVEVSQARASYVQARSDLVQVQYDLIFQKRKIDYYVGALDPEQPLFE